MIEYSTIIWKIKIVQYLAMHWRKSDKDVMHILNKYNVFYYLEKESDWLDRYGPAVMEEEVRDIINDMGGSIEE